MIRVLLVSLLSLVGCSGDPAEDGTGPLADSPARAAIPAELIDATWPVQIHKGGKLDQVMANSGWQHMFNQELATAAGAFGPDSVETTRIHATAAGIYRQAALMQAYAIIETFKADERREGDPEEVAYLLGVSHILLGDLDAARNELGAQGDSAVAALAAADAAWASRIAGEFALTGPIADPALYPLGEVVPGTFPSIDPGPHYKIAQGEFQVELSDPTVLLQAAWWHQAAGGQLNEELTAALIAPWRIPGEDPADVTLESAPVEALFLGGWLTAADAEFFAALGPVGTTGADQAADTIEDFATRSAYAAVVQGCRTEATVDVECLLDASLSTGKQLEEAMATAMGSPASDHRMYANFARAGVLRAGARAAGALGDVDSSALLRINALDRSDGPAADPNFLLAQAAWDASRRNPLRAQELLHKQLSTVPGLQAARVSLDSLHLRVSRDAGPALPMH